LEEGDIPMEVIEYCKQIKEKMGIYKNSIFSLDFAFSSEKNQRFLLEINYSPGIRFPEKDKKYQINYFEKLVSFFISMV
jgi:glutathione synthase/RimK-type ligase-like ATP-grasp enzyme